MLFYFFNKVYKILYEFSLIADISVFGFYECIGYTSILHHWYFVKIN